ncbi:hypothetical protein D3C78_1116740 [compost metagenome]
MGLFSFDNQEMNGSLVSLAMHSAVVPTYFLIGTKIPNPPFLAHSIGSRSPQTAPTGYSLLALQAPRLSALRYPSRSLQKADEISAVQVQREQKAMPMCLHAKYQHVALCLRKYMPPIFFCLYPAPSPRSAATFLTAFPTALL